MGEGGNSWRAWGLERQKMTSEVEWSDKEVLKRVGPPQKVKDHFSGNLQIKRRGRKLNFMQSHGVILKR